MKNEPPHLSQNIIGFRERESEREREKQRNREWVETNVGCGSNTRALYLSLL